MERVLTKVTIAVLTVIMLNFVLCTGSAQAVEIDWPEPNWPEIFEPNQLLTLNLEIDPCDWAFIVREVSPTVDPKTYTEVPAWFWMDGEEDLKIVVSVRKKSCVMMPEPGYTIPGDPNLIDPNKVKISLKIDINQYYGEDPNAATDWHDLKKVSLENGGTTGVQAEGLSCNIHRMASGPEGYGYDDWRTSWVKLYVNDDYKGVYTSNEQIDKQFLKHRGIFVSHNSWLYKSWGTGALELKVGDEDFPFSPALDALCYKPFPCLVEDSPIYIGENLCGGPNDVDLVADMNEWVNMQGLLALGAVNTFMANHDALFGANGHNFYFFDFNLPDPCETRKRMFFPWDNDGGFAATDYGIDENSENAGADSYAGLILGHPTLRSHYNQIMKDLIDGPLSEANIHAFIDDVNTSELRAAIIADQWNTVLGNPAAKFAELKTWISDRIPNVLAQVELDEPEILGIILLNDGFDDGLGGAAWNANWTGSWFKDTDTYSHGRPSASATNGSEGTFTSGDLDANDATAIHVDFKFKKKGIESPTDFTVSYYNGASYNTIADLETLGGDNEWLHYTDTITDSQYFDPNFKIQFNADLGGGEDVWVDDVYVTKEAPMMISGYILDPCTAAIEGVSVDADNAGGSDVTDVNGYYELFVPFNWTGTVTPTKTGYTFDPASRIYDVNVTEGQINQDYTAILNTYTISGQILDPNNRPIIGVSVDADNGGGSDTTGTNGEYSITVDHGWSGTVTPTKAEYTFNPQSITYSVPVTGDQTNQDYVGTSIYDLVADGFIDFKDLDVFVAAWLSGQGDGNWNADCNFYTDLRIDFKDFAKFAQAWQP